MNLIVKMFQLQLNIKKLINLILVTALLAIQLFNMFIFNSYGVIELDIRIINHQLIKSNNCTPSETLFTKKDIKELQNSFPYFEKQKYKHDYKFNIPNAKLLFTAINFNKDVFYFQEVADNNLIPRSPPQIFT